MYTVFNFLENTFLSVENISVYKGTLVLSCDTEVDFRKKGYFTV